MNQQADVPVSGASPSGRGSPEQAATPLADNPANRLSGMVLDGGWRVGERLVRPPDATGGCHSCCYLVRSASGQTAFLKALDVARALEEEDLSRALLILTQDFEFEKTLLERCRRMDRIVHSIAYGIAIVDSTSLGRVPYLILEMGDRDIRSQLALVDAVDTAWRLRTLHDAATALKQLHSGGIVHQDLKPSNVVVFGQRLSKVTDLGRAAALGVASRFDELDIPGDLRYSPPELVFGHFDADWSKRRIGSDLYQLGSLAVFLFSGGMLTHLIASRLSKDHRPPDWGGSWRGSYREVLPYVREAYDGALEPFEESLTRLKLRIQLAETVRQLTDPDPDVRGDPISRGRGGNPFSLERYITRFDLLAKREEFVIRRSL